MNFKTDPWLKTFLVIFTGQAFSLLGSSAVNFALVWWLTAETGSATVLAYASIAALLPQALLGPIAGPFVDRWDRRLTIMGADLFIAATSIVLIVLYATGTPGVAVVIAAIAARSLGAAFHTPASQAAVPMYVPAEHLMRVSGWNFFLGSGVAMAAPVIGAFLIGVAPMAAVIAIDVVGALVAVGLLMSVRIPHPERAADDPETAGFVAEFAAGWHELRSHRGLFDLTLFLVAVTLLYMPLSALFPLMVRAHFGGGALAASAVEFAFGAGMLLGSLAIGAITTRMSGIRVLTLGIVVMGIMCGVSGLLPSTAFYGFVAFTVVMGVTVPMFGAPTTALFQQRIDPSKLGRVMSLYMTMSMLVAPVGLVLAGPLAEKTGIAPWFGISGLLLALTGAAMWLAPAVRELDEPVGAAPEETSVESAA